MWLIIVSYNSAPSQQVCTIKKSESDVEVDVENVQSTDKPNGITESGQKPADCSDCNKSAQVLDAATCDNNLEKDVRKYYTILLCLATISPLSLSVYLKIGPTSCDGGPEHNHITPLCNQFTT